MNYPYLFRQLLAALCALLFSGNLAAATAPEIFTRANRNVLLLEGRNGQDEIIVQASAIAMGDGVSVTQCDLLPGTERLAVIQDRRRYLAYPRERDESRNLCRLDVPGLRAAKAEIVGLDQIRVGQRVFAIGNALGLGLSLSEGLVSGIRERGGESWIQTTAALAPGSEGGTLFDDQGRLLGLTNYRKRDGQNVNFAAPAAWIPDIVARADSMPADQAAAFRHGADCARLTAADNWKELAQVAESWVHDHPEPGEAWYWLGLARERQKDYKGALTAFEKALEGTPDSVSMVLAVVRLHQNLEQNSQALDVLRQALSHNQEAAELWYAKALVEGAMGQGDAGWESLRTVLRLDPRHAGAWELQASVARARNDPGGLRQAAANLSAIAPENPNYWRLLAEAYLLEGRPARAWKAILRAEELTPGMPDILVTRGTILFRLGAYGEAIDALKKALAAKPEQSANTHALLGNAYYQIKLYPEAIASLREAVRLAPDHSPYQYILGLVLKDSYQWEAALKLFESLRDKAKDDASVWRQFGLINAMMGRYAEAIAAFEQSLRLAPDQSKVWHALGETYARTGRRDDALRAYQRLRSLDAQAAEQLYRGHLIAYEAKP